MRWRLWMFRSVLNKSNIYRC